MATISIGFEWPRGRTYEIVEPALPRSKDPFAKTIDEPHIRQTGRTEREIPARQPLEIHPSLHLDFAGLGHSPDACLQFARSWGLLTQPAEVGAQEPLSRWFREIEVMRQTVEGLRRAFEEKVVPIRGALITDLEVLLVSGKPDGRPTLSLRPFNLLGAMRIQLAQSVASGNAINVCPVCGNWFEKGGRGGDAKRSIARFCSDRCRTQFHNDRRTSK